MSYYYFSILLQVHISMSITQPNTLIQYFTAYLIELFFL